MKQMEVDHITFYQSVKIGRREYNTIHQASKETDLIGIACIFLPELGLMRVSGGKLERDIYIGMANVRRFECDKITSGVLFDDELGQQTDDSEEVLTTGERHETIVESVATKPVADLSDEDEKIILTAAIKKHGINPHPMTGTKKLKEKLKKLEAEAK